MPAAVAALACPGVTRPDRIRSASTRASSSRCAQPAARTSSAPASRKAIRASTSPAGATTRHGVGMVEAVRMEPMAPVTERPSATTRSIARVTQRGDSLGRGPHRAHRVTGGGEFLLEPRRAGRRAVSRGGSGCLPCGPSSGLERRGIGRSIRAPGRRDCRAAGERLYFPGASERGGCVAVVWLLSAASADARRSSAAVP